MDLIEFPGVLTDLEPQHLQHFEDKFPERPEVFSYPRYCVLGCACSLDLYLDLLELPGNAFLPGIQYGHQGCAVLCHCDSVLIFI
ncbi:hypothetical protein SFRURICE_011106 [Spodoptera frugiperda]|nr:hypothetical protein SFRURICE_011106 [Spodoptera frugiperda]